LRVVGRAVVGDEDLEPVARPLLGDERVERLGQQGLAVLRCDDYRESGLLHVALTTTAGHAAPAKHWILCGRCGRCGSRGSCRSYGFGTMDESFVTPPGAAAQAVGHDADALK